MTTATLDCQATLEANCRPVNPSALSMAMERRRRRTEATRVSPIAVTAPTVSPRPRSRGVEPIDR